MTDDTAFDQSRTAWISRGFEQLVRQAAAGTPRYDVVIIGSGYGGAVAAATFAGRRHQHDGSEVSVCMLERGNEYLPGAFPSGFTEIPAHVRMDSRKTGLFDIRLGPEVCTVVANGVGGGSLINAGVMEIPEREVFEHHWPGELSDRTELDPYYKKAKKVLGAERNGSDNTIEDHPDGLPQKFVSIRNLAAGADSFKAAAITMAMNDSTSSGGVRLNKCLQCGDCATGCNHGAKDSLDVNLLVRAHLAGAKIYSGATVLSIERHEEEPVWVVSAVYTDAKLRARHGEPIPIHATNVVLAAGTLGSTEILKRSENGALRFSHQLGRRCSTNGDMLITDYDTDSRVNTIADEAVSPSDRAVGPTITGVMKTRQEGQSLIVEEMAVPAGLRRAFAEIFATTNALHSLSEADWSAHRDGIPGDDIYLVGPERIERCALYAIMGDDGANGRIELDGDPGTDRDGIARIRWESLPSYPVFSRQVKALTRLTAGTNGRLLPNPAWRLLPDDMSFLINNRKGPLLTVHPLGGCAMADTAEFGVVNHRGEVFDPTASTTALHPGLVVLDGAIVPTALATNPALTITAVALRAAESLAGKWRYVEAAGSGGGPGAAPLDRPVFREVDQAHDPAPTKVELNERMAGPVTFTDAAGTERDCVVELTLRSEAKALAELTTPPAHGGDPELRVDGAWTGAVTDSRIRIYNADDWTRINLERVSAQTMERQLDAACLYEAPLSGALRVLERRRSFAWCRLLRAGWAWIWNRGLRDSWQAIFNGGNGPGLGPRLKGGIALASRAGEVRLIGYDLRVGRPAPGSPFELAGDRITGIKRFTYNRRANPWRQLMAMSLDGFPGLARREARRVLELDLEFLARIGVPLFKIKEQPDGATALAEIASFFGYFLRLLVGIHIWSFRSPDKDERMREPVRLPGALPGLPAPEIHTVHVGDETPDGAVNGAPVPVDIRLTRYAAPDSRHPPVLMIHGYSASGTTFAHPAVRPNFASYFRERGRDVWVLDMRTSSGMDTATQPWSFEQAAYRDIPIAVDHIHRETGKKLDVIAHCMGAVMFSMAVLHSNELDLAREESFLYQQVRRSLKDRVERVAFIQVGPLVVFSPANIFRGYASRFLIEFLPDHYTFRPGPDASLADDLLDRILSTLPYPEEEFDIENPPWPPWRRTPWVRTRHRMDALYGRDFNVANMGPEVLDRIDDHFGPLSIKTVAQTIHFARYSIITNKEGRNTFVSRWLFYETWKFPAHSVHARYNGLSAVATVFRMNEILTDAGRPYSYDIIGREAKAGHQDALVGRPRMQTFDSVRRFFEAPRREPREAELNKHMNAYPPWLGPIVTVEEQDTLPQPTRARSIRLGTRPTHRAPVGVIMLRASYDGDRVNRPDGQPWDQQYIQQNMLMFSSSDLREGWGKFWEPDENTMPKTGNGLLVLVVYDEAEELGESGAAYLRTVLQEGDWALQRLWPIGWREIGLIPGSPPSPVDPDQIEKQEPIDFPSIRLPEDRILEMLEAMTDTVAKVLQDQDTELVVAPDDKPAPERRDTLDMPLEFRRCDELGNTTEIRFRETEDLVHGFIPDPEPDGAAFALVSCQYPAGFLDGSVAGGAYAQVADRMDRGGAITPRFTVLTGDQVYVDATAGLYDPTQGDERYERPYLAWLRDPHVRGALRRAPSFMMLDDHEIDDNWEPFNQNDEDNRALMTRGRASYIKYQRGLSVDAAATDLSFTFNHGGIDFFMLNTRTERAARRASNVELQPMVSDADLAALEMWLQQGNGPKFIVSPPMLLPRHRRSVQWDEEASALHSDGWDGYRHTLSKVVELIAANDVQHVVFLSGDEHRGCVANIDITDTATGNVVHTHSIHTQGAYTPFPFANSLEEDFIKNEQITFENGGAAYTCDVNTVFQSSRNGATYLNPRLENGAWKLDYQFGDGDVRTIEI